MEDSIEINGIKYVRASEPQGKMCVIRSARAGVFFGHIADREGQRVTMATCRRIWSWQGANTISEIATSGIDVGKSKVSAETRDHEIYEVIECVPMTARSQSIMAGASWK